jgi:protease-4
VLGLSGAFLLLLIIVSGAFFMRGATRSAGGKKTSVSLFGGGAVGVIELNGVIMDSKKILDRLEDFEDDDRVKAVVLRLNSPGGSVAPSQEIYEAVKAYKKPLVVSMGSVAASGAFYIACGAKKVFANPGTITGSIGVIMEFVNLQKLYEWAKVKRFAIKTGKFKDAGAEFREMTAEEKDLLQGMVDDVLLQFKSAISKGRKLPMETVSAIADGRIFSGTQAKARKLVDELGTLQDAIDEAAKEAKLPGRPDVVYPTGNKRRLLQMLFDDSSRDEEGRADQSLLERLVSRVFGVVSNREAPALEPGIYWLWSG